jgi:hypothetical protein
MGAGEDRSAALVFPAYRRMKATGHLYRIESARRFIELQPVGNRWLKHVVDAVAYPEQVRVHEMMACANGIYEALEGRDWDKALLQTQQ